MQRTRIARRLKPRPKALWTTLPSAQLRANTNSKPPSHSPHAPRRAKRVRPVSPGRAKLLRAYRADRLTFLRAHPRCDRCGAQGHRDVHHTRGRAGTLLLDSRHWRALCRECHDWVGENPAEARLLGLLCPAGLWNVPDPIQLPPLK